MSKIDVLLKTNRTGLVVGLLFVLVCTTYSIKPDEFQVSLNLLIVFFDLSVQLCSAC